MAFWLRSEERRVAARGRRVRADTAAVETARQQFATGLRHELARPKVLLAFFAAGLGYGWLRRANSADRRPPRNEAEDQSAQAGAPKTGRLAAAVAAVLAGVRIYDQVRRAAAFIDRQGRRRESAPFAEDASYPVQQHQAHERYEAGE